MTDDPDLRDALHHHDPRLPTQPAFSRSLRDVVSAASFGLELLFALGGLVLLWPDRRREVILLGAVVFAYALGHALFVGRLRYRITVLPLVFLFAGAGASALYAAIRGRLAARGP